jgi:hypothetical protein
MPGTRRRRRQCGARHDVGRLEHPQGLGGEEKPGVVVEHVQDLDLGGVCELPVGDVRLPPLVGLIGLETDERALRPLLGLRGDEAPTRQDPPDRPGSGGAAVASGEVSGDGVSPGVQTLVGELVAERDDLVLDPLGGAPRTSSRPARPRVEPSLALGIKSTAELVDPSPRPGSRGPPRPSSAPAP